MGNDVAFIYDVTQAGRKRLGILPDSFTALFIFIRNIPAQSVFEKISGCCGQVP
jgi:hypothetical protein